MLLQVLAEVAHHWPWFWPMVGAVVGSVLASFAGCMAYRIPRGQRLTGPSVCNHCQQHLGAAQLIPVLSWAWQRGRSRCCGKALPRSLILTEALAAAGGALLAGLLQP